jgi:hypothetical protein
MNLLCKIEYLMYKQKGNSDYNYFNIYSYRQFDGNERAEVIMKFYDYSNINIGDIEVIKI